MKDAELIELCRRAFLLVRQAGLAPVSEGPTIAEVFKVLLAQHQGSR